MKTSVKIVSWNIQWGRGADGRVDLPRTAHAIRALGGTHGADLICLQEVASNLAGLAGGAREDEPTWFGEAFADYEPVYGPALDIRDGEGGRSRFGNLILSRLPVDQVFRHLLPSPPDPEQPSMQRVCVEAVVAVPWGWLRVMTTHLEYYSQRQRRAQVEALRALQREVAANAAAAGSPRREPNPGFAARPRPASAVLCGDFNCEPDSAEYAALCEPLGGSAPGWRDAWRIRHPHTPHDATVGLHGAEWPDRPYCCDFFFVTADIATLVKGLEVDADTPASDHQPVVLTLSAG